MSKTKKNCSKPLQERLTELERTGNTGPVIHRRLESEGYVVSLASVTRALRLLRGPQRVGRRVPARSAKVDPPARTPAGAPAPLATDGDSSSALPTVEDLRRGFAGQIRAIEAELAGAESPALRTSLNRILVSARQHLARVTPAPPENQDPNTRPDYVELAHRGEERLLQLIRGTFKVRESDSTAPPNAGAAE